MSAEAGDVGGDQSAYISGEPQMYTMPEATEGTWNNAASDTAQPVSMDIISDEQNQQTGGTTNGQYVDPDPEVQEWIQKGLDQSVAAQLVHIFNEGVMNKSEFEDRTLEQLKVIRPDHAKILLEKFEKANLRGVQNKSSYLGTALMTFIDKSNLLGPQPALENSVIMGPQKEKLDEILDRTGYPLEVTTGQRKYGPPPDWDGPQPGNGCELYIGRIPPQLFEDALIPLFETAGRIYDLRLMMDAGAAQNKGYSFCVYATKEDAANASKKFNDYEIEPGRKLICNVSIANTRLFVGNIPKIKTKEEIFEEFSSLTEGLGDVIVYTDPNDPRPNRGFCFLQYEEHKGASAARRKLMTGRIKPWNRDIQVDWAEPMEEPDEETMSKVKVLYIKNLKAEVTEEMVREKFAPFGEIERLKRQKDFAFVHYMERDSAVKAMEELQGYEFNGEKCHIALAKPQTEVKKKKHNIQMRQGRGGGMGGGDGWGGRGGFGPPPGGPGPRGGRGRGGGPPGYGYYDAGYGGGGGFGGDFNGGYGYGGGPPGGFGGGGGGGFGDGWYDNGAGGGGWNYGGGGYDDYGGYGYGGPPGPGPMGPRGPRGGPPRGGRGGGMGPPSRGFSGPPRGGRMPGPRGFGPRPPGGMGGGRGGPPRMRGDGRGRGVKRRGSDMMMGGGAPKRGRGTSNAPSNQDFTADSF